LPVLLVSGEDDHIVPTQDSVGLSKMIPDAELKIFRD